MTSAEQYTSILVKSRYKISKPSHLPKPPIPLCCVKVPWARWWKPSSCHTSMICLLLIIWNHRLSFAKCIKKCKLHLVTTLNFFLPYLDLSTWHKHVLFIFTTFFWCKHAVQSLVVNKFSVPPNTGKPPYIKLMSYHQIKSKTAQHYYKCNSSSGNAMLVKIYCKTE